MIIPSRWFSGGKGLDDFRDEMLNDSRIRQLVDYTDSTEVFPGVDIAGGICYFLWDRDNMGPCRVENIHSGKADISIRQLNEFDTFVRDSLSLSIIKKVRASSDSFLDLAVSSRRPFGLESKIRPLKHGDLTLVSSGGRGPFPRSMVVSGRELIDKWKVLCSKASFDHGGQPDKEGKRRVFSIVEKMPPGTVCTETYLIVGPYETEREAENMVSYLRTKFCSTL
jgi:site-specific DNA-methyltransferase (adenine-specific)